MDFEAVLAQPLFLSLLCLINLTVNPCRAMGLVWWGLDSWHSAMAPHECRVSTPSYGLPDRC